jgi:hypothetical protein
MAFGDGREPVGVFERGAPVVDRTRAHHAEQALTAALHDLDDLGPVALDPTRGEAREGKTRREPCRRLDRERE